MSEPLQLPFQLSAEGMRVFAAEVARELHLSVVEEAWTADELAAKLKISGRAVRDRCRAGKIRRVPGLPPSIYRIPAAEVRRLLGGV